MRSKYTNPDCCAVIKCRLHCCYEEKSVGGIFYRGYIKSPLRKFFTMSSSLKIFKEKKPGCFDPGLFLIRTVLYSLIVQ